MANHALPATTSTYANFVTELDGRLDDLALGLDPSFATTATNLIANSIRWNSVSGANRWERYDGVSTWTPLATSYNININGTVGATTASTGAFTTLSTSGIANLGTGSTVNNVAIVTTTGTETLTNKTLTAPVISTITNNSITLTLPTTVDTLVGRATTDTLTNKTLTAPRVATTDFIADGNGLAYLRFVQTASAVNQLTITNSATGVAPSLAATGTDVNISLNLQSKGTGVVQVNGANIVTTTGTQTLTNKTLTAPVISTITNNSITLTLPTTVDTLVGRATTDTLTNKTLTAPKFANSGFIADANGIEVLKFTTTASAVNHVVLANSAATGDVSLTTAGTDANISLDIVGKGTGTLKVDGIPVATTTDSQTLTNKSLTDSTTFFINETTATKRMQFQLSGITAATTRTITVPDTDITLFGTSSTDTLTNKTMSTGSVWNGGTIGVAYGGTGTTAALIQGGIIYGNSTTAYASTAAGTQNQVLQSNGTSPPSWTALDVATHLPDSSYKKIVRAATVAKLDASTFAANVLTGYSNVVSLAVSTTAASNVATTTSTAGIKVGAVITGNDANITAGTTVASITNATTFTISANALATSTSITTTFTQTIAALVVDGITLAANDRVLVKDESTLGGLGSATAGRTNGIYTVTNPGSASVAWVLTRTADADASSDIDAALVNVAVGSTNGGKSFKTTFLLSDTLNTTPMYWNRLADFAASSFLGTPATAAGVDLQSEAKTVMFNTGNVADLAINSFGVKTIQSLAASTYTNAATVYIAGAPAASTNATITNSYSLHVAAGTTLLNGNLFVTGGTISAGNVTTSLLGGNTSTNISIGAGLTTGTYTVGATGSTGAVTLFPATGIQNITLGGATTGTITVGSTSAAAVQLPSGKTKVGQTFVTQGGAVTITLPTVAGTLVGSGDTGTVSNTMLAGSIANAKLTNSSVTIGTTAISLGGSSTTLAGLTSVTSTGFTGALTGNATTVTNGVYTTDTGTVTNTMLAGSIANAKLTNSSVTIGTTAISLGASSTTLGGLTSVTSTGFTGALTGNVTGNCSGSSGSCTGNSLTATTATGATNINISAITSTDTATSVVLVAAQATGNQVPFVDSGLLYNASTNVLSVSISGNAATATTATTATNQSGGTVNGTSVEGSYVGVNNTSSTTGYGVSLYGGSVAGAPTYGIMFAGTATFGTYSGITDTFSTYFVSSATAGRGWVFKAGTGTAGNVAAINNSGTAVFSGNVTAFSDLRLKSDIVVIADAVHKVKQLRGVTYTRIDDASLGRQTGVIAQEVLQVLPEAVLGTEQTTYSVAYGNMVGLLIEAIKEQQQQLDTQQQRIDKLEQLVLQLIGDNK